MLEPQSDSDDEVPAVQQPAPTQPGRIWQSKELLDNTPAPRQARILNAHDLLLTPFDYFRHFLAWPFIVERVLPATNARAKTANPGWQDVDMTEFLVWLGIWMFFLSFDFADRRQFWATTPVDIDNPFFRVNGYMARNRFEDIYKFLTLWNEALPEGDHFFAVRKLFSAFAEQTKHSFAAGSRVCLDESMVPWLKRWTCPGRIFVKGKPHPMGNEYRTMADCDTGIMLFAEIVEGRHKSKDYMPPFHQLGPTCGLLYRAIDQCGLSGSQRHLFVDSGYTSAEAVAGLLDNNIYVTCAVKKRKYWPKHVPGADITAAVSQWQLFESKYTTITVPYKTNSSNTIGVFVMNDPQHAVVFLSSSATT
jgi:hypothetical protein